MPDHLALVQPNYRLCERVVVAVADASNRGVDPSFSQSIRVSKAGSAIASAECTGIDSLCRYGESIPQLRLCTDRGWPARVHPEPDQPSTNSTLAIPRCAARTRRSRVPVQLKRDTLRLHSMEQGGITDEQETSSTDVRAGREGSHPAPAFGRQDGRFRPV